MSASHYVHHVHSIVPKVGHEESPTSGRPAECQVSRIIDVASSFGADGADGAEGAEGADVFTAE
jgi:hypothetical protein